MANIPVFHSPADATWNLLSAFEADIGFLPDKKQRAASAKLRGISAAILPLSRLAAADMGEDELCQFIVAAWRLMFAYESGLDMMAVEVRAAKIPPTVAMFDDMFGCIFRMKGDIKIVAFEGDPYEPNYPVSAVNGEDFANGDNLAIMQTLEPALVRDGRALHFAKVVLAQQSSLLSHLHGSEHASRH